MKKTIGTILMVLNTGVMMVQASVFVGVGPTDDKVLSAYNWTVTDLNNATPTASGDSDPLISGSLTKAAGASESFTMTFTGASDWNAGSAQTAIANLATDETAFSTYLSNLSYTNLDYETAQDALGVAGSGSNDNRLDGAGEVLICTFGADNLTSGSLVLNDVFFDFGGNANDYADYLLYDVSEKSVTQIAWDSKWVSFPAGEYAVDTGDILFMAVGASAGGEFRFAGLTMDVVPEPATLGLMAIFGGGLLFYRRHFLT